MINKSKKGSRNERKVYKAFVAAGHEVLFKSARSRFNPFRDFAHLFDIVTWYDDKLWFISVKSKKVPAKHYREILEFKKNHWSLNAWYVICKLEKQRSSSQTYATKESIGCQSKNSKLERFKCRKVIK